jgi:hypothetical protein
MRHLKSEHPAYARGLLFRVAAPAIFLIELVILAAVHAPEIVYLIALFTTFGLLFFGRQRSRSERTKAGASPTLGLKRLVKEGGLGFMMIIPAIILLVVVLSRR